MTTNRENDLAIGQDSPLYHIRQFFDAIQRTTDEYLFVVDLSSGLTLLSNNFVEEFNLQSSVVTDIDSLLMENIYPDDQERYAESIHNVLIEKVSDTYELEFRLLNQDGDYGWAECRGFVSHDKDGNEIMRTGVVSRLDKRRHADDVTGLLNRFSLSRSLRQELSSPDSHGAVVSVGLDNFHVISETYGYHFADIAMRQIAQNISNVLPPDVNLYKLDGDQFALMLPDAMPEEIEIIFASIQLIRFTALLQLEQHSILQTRMMKSRFLNTPRLQWKSLVSRAEIESYFSHRKLTIAGDMIRVCSH